MANKFDTIREFAGQILSGEGMELGTPVLLDEVTFIPILRHETPREERDYLTLSEALDEELCKIIDKGNEVAHIVFENKSDFPIMIEEGEIFKGQGTQDRVSVGTIMVEPHISQEIPVKCVHAPHGLRTGAAFGYGGKVSRSMLNTFRSMKYANAMNFAAASTISQGRVWDHVSKELADEEEVSENTKYLKGVEARRKRAEKRSKSLEFPDNTIGLVVINADGEVKGVEIHRLPRNFKLRQEGIMESLESSISWESKGKGAYPKPAEKAKEVFTKISELKEGEHALNQVEIEGLAINLDGIQGEAYTKTFYSGQCPKCGQNKPRVKACPNCGHSEDDNDEVAYFSCF